MSWARVISGLETLLLFNVWLFLFPDNFPPPPPPPKKRTLRGDNKVALVICGILRYFFTLITILLFNSKAWECETKNLWWMALTNKPLNLNAWYRNIFKILLYIYCNTFMLAVRHLFPVITLILQLTVSCPLQWKSIRRNAANRVRNAK